MKHSKLARLLAGQDNTAARTATELRLALKVFVDFKCQAETVGRQIDLLFAQLAQAEADVEQLIIQNPKAARECRADIDAAMGELDAMDEMSVPHGSWGLQMKP